MRRLLRAHADRLPGSLRALAKGVTRVAGAGADITIAKRLTGSIEITLRMVAMSVTGSQPDQGGKRKGQGKLVLHHDA
jgi:hypothetical protein